MCFDHTAIVCPPLSQWAGLTFESRDFSVGAVVNATCGYVQGQGQMRFADSAPFKLTVCNSSVEWDPVLPSCVGKALHHLLLERMIVQVTFFNLLSIV